MGMLDKEITIWLTDDYSKCTTIHVPSTYSASQIEDVCNVLFGELGWFYYDINK
jgi:hypothetical protein